MFLIVSKVDSFIQSIRRLHSIRTLYHLQVSSLTRFQDRNPKDEARLGRTAGHVMPLPLDGFTKSTKVNNFGPQINTTKRLQNLEPYVGR